MFISLIPFNPILFMKKMRFKTIKLYNLRLEKLSTNINIHAFSKWYNLLFLSEEIKKFILSFSVQKHRLRHLNWVGQRVNDRRLN